MVQVSEGNGPTRRFCFFENGDRVYKHLTFDEACDLGLWSSPFTTFIPLRRMAHRATWGSAPDGLDLNPVTLIEGGKGGV